MNTDYWKDFYQKNAAPEKPSDFAVFVSMYIERLGVNRDRPLVDLACGNGRDSRYFASRGFNTIGIDLVDHPVESPETVKYVTGDFTKIDIKAAVYYCRFAVHAISETALDDFINNVRSTMDLDSILFIETRSTKGIADDKDSHLHNFTSSVGTAHDRMLYSMKYLMDKFKSAGFDFDYVAEGRGMAVHGHEDPFVIRLAIRKKETTDERMTRISRTNELISSICTNEHKLKQKGKLEVLRTFVMSMEDAGLEYWLGYGTLVGCMRHGGFAPWDDDVDVCINSCDLRKVLQSSKTLEFHRRNNTLFGVFDPVTSNEIDMFVLAPHPQADKEMRPSEIYPLKRMMFHDIDCMVPNDPHPFFMRRYAGLSPLKHCLVWNHSVNDYWDKEFDPKKYWVKFEELDDRWKNYTLD